jgi:hypothetical protein
MRFVIARVKFSVLDCFLKLAWIFVFGRFLFRLNSAGCEFSMSVSIHRFDVDRSVGGGGVCVGVCLGGGGFWLVVVLCPRSFLYGVDALCRVSSGVSARLGHGLVGWFGGSPWPWRPRLAFPALVVVWVVCVCVCVCSSAGVLFLSRHSAAANRF